MPAQLRPVCFAASLVALLVALLVMSLVASPAFAVPPAANHPLIGVWRLSLDGGMCFETYRFRQDGASLVTSAGEVSESDFAIGAQPSARGFISWKTASSRTTANPIVPAKS